MSNSEQELDIALNELADTAATYGENSARTVGRIKSIRNLVQDHTDEMMKKEHRFIKELTDEAHLHEQNGEGSGIQYFDNLRLERYKQYTGGK